LPYSPWHEALWQFLASSSLVFGAWYIGWRWVRSVNWDALWFSIPLLLAETGAFIGLVLFTVNLWTARAPKPGRLPASIRDCSDDPETPDRPIIVDVFFATYSEDPELVRHGLKDAKAFTYPHPIEVAIHVLDDGKRPAMEAVAREEGVNYLTRTNNIGFKAGNLRNAMESTSGDFIMICDADMRPFPTFLEQTLGYFRDPKVAWVQTPHWFHDVPPGVPLPAVLERWLGGIGRGLGRCVERVYGPVRVGEDPFANDPQLFFDVIERRRNWANASFCCGAGSIHRRDAVMEAALRQWSDKVVRASERNERAIRKLTGEADLVDTVSNSGAHPGRARRGAHPLQVPRLGGFLHLHRAHSDRERGWKSVLHPVVQARMLSPNDLLSWTIQRFKYAGGTLDIFFHDNPLFRKGLKLQQKLMYAATFYSYLSPCGTSSSWFRRSCSCSPACRRWRATRSTSSSTSRPSCS
jgi:cellulose synthase (UDP-forming)